MNMFHINHKKGNNGIIISIFLILMLTLNPLIFLSMNLITLKIDTTQNNIQEPSIYDLNSSILNDNNISFESDDLNLRNTEKTNDAIAQNQIRNEDNSNLPEIEVLNEDEQGLTIDFTISDVIVENVIDISGETYQKVDIMGGGHLTEIGKPELPTKGVYLNVPESVDFEVVVKNSKYYEEFGYNVYPSQKMVPEIDDSEKVIERNATFYEENKFFPNNFVELKEVGIIRGHRTALLIICPIAYNPLSKIIRIYDQLQIEVKYVKNDEKERSITHDLSEISRYLSSDFSSFLESIYLNYDSSVDKKLSETSQIEAYGADYLIITPDEFYDEIIPLAQHKSNKGLLTEIVNLSNIGIDPSADDISAYIQDAYDTWNPVPTYLLLVGDSELLPPHYKTIHPYHGTLTPTDLYYATLDGTDYFPDIFLGRLPVKTESELTIVVNKIINYEQNFNQTDPWRRNVTLAAYEQYGRYFIPTCENISNFLETKDYDITKIYTGGSYTGTTQDVIDAINNGTFLVNHRDHGEWYGWGDPSFTVNDIDELKNGDMLPAMFSINCLSGRFDYTQDCFAEVILKAENKGVIGCIASTRVSYSGYNDELDKGFISSIWPDYQSSYDNYVGKSAKLGHILNFGKMYMYDKYYLTGGAGYPWTPSATTTLIEFEMFTLFGDPDLSILEVDHDLEVSIDIPNNPNITETYRVNATVYNTGFKEMSDVNLYLYCEDQIVENIHIPTLSDGDNITVNYDWTPQSYGIFNFTAYAPPKMEEFYYGNNRITKFANVKRDLSVDLEVPLITYLEDSYQINATITNDGPSTEYNVDFYLKIDDDIKNFTCIPSLQFKESYTLNYNWTPVDFGIYNITCDTPLRQGEFNLSNNNITMLSRIRRDLTVDLTVPLKIYLGKSYVINATITNNGSTEIDIEFCLKIDNDVKNFTNIPSLQFKESFSLTYNWTPNDYGNYNISSNTPLRDGEIDMINNANQEYRRISPIIFKDDFENGLSNWNSVDGLWHFTNIHSPWPNPCHSPTYSMWFGMESTGNFQTGYREYGSFISNSINLSDVSSAYLDFYHWMEGEYLSSYDIGYVFISNNGTDWDEIYRISRPCNPWQYVNLNISSYCGYDTVYLRFYYDTRDSLYNYYRGWLIDDVEIYTNDYNYKQKNLECPPHPPSLTNEDVIPSIGHEDTLLTFRATYSDFNNDAPSQINVIINGTPYAMIKQDSLDYDYTDGCIYEYYTYLNPSSHNYQYFFNCSDGKYQIATDLYDDLKIHSKPTLTDVSVTPKIGYADTLITFIVNYTDLDNEAPLQINVRLINYMSYEMVKQDELDNDYTDGCIYVLCINLIPRDGNYSYYFYCSDDGVNSASTNTYNDLRIHSKPVLTNEYVTPSSGYPDTLFTFRVTYTDLDNDAPSQINLIINGTPYVMVKYNYYDNYYADGCIYENTTYLSLAPYNYIYYFNCSDGEHYYTTSVYNNLRIHNKPTLSIESVSPKQGYENTLISFRVNYTDLDNEVPSQIRVIINGIHYSMIKQDFSDNNFSDGCIYVFSCYLSPSSYNYTYWFRYSDDGVNFLATEVNEDLKITQNPFIVSDDGDNNNRKKGKSNEGNDSFLPIIIGVSSILGISAFLTLLFVKKLKLKLLKHRENEIS